MTKYLKTQLFDIPPSRMFAHICLVLIKVFNYYLHLMLLILLYTLLNLAECLEKKSEVIAYKRHISSQCRQLLLTRQPIAADMKIWITLQFLTLSARAAFATFALITTNVEQA
uniref:Uncharacterized protein n=1 Tax=Glossina austeni TaxID=7395 RepID=A0A1A9VLQ6_GLOAU